MPDIPADVEALRDAVEAIRAVIAVIAGGPENFTLNLIQGSNDKLTLQVKASKKAIGQLIGMQGRTARSLRIILIAMLHSSKTGLTLDFVELDREPSTDSG